MAGELSENAGSGPVQIRGHRICCTFAGPVTTFPSVIHVLPVRSPTLPPATHTNVYRVGRMVFDVASPYPEEQARTLQWVRESPVPVDTIVLTHHHADHVGGAAVLRDALLADGVPARILAHREAVLPFAVDGTIEDGDSLDTGDGTLTALHTPGHADGHLVFLAENGDCIAGDLVAGIGTILIAPPEGHLETYLSSLRRMLPLARRLYPAHGPDLPGETTLRQYLFHRAMRNEQVRSTVAALRREGRTVDPQTVAERVYAGIPGVNSEAAALQVAAILNWLEEAHVG